MQRGSPWWGGRCTRGGVYQGWYGRGSTQLGYIGIARAQPMARVPYTGSQSPVSRVQYPGSSIQGSDVRIQGSDVRIQESDVRIQESVSSIQYPVSSISARTGHIQCPDWPYSVPGLAIIRYLRCSYGRLTGYILNMEILGPVEPCIPTAWSLRVRVQTSMNKTR